MYTFEAPRSRAITACQHPIGPVPRITTVSPSLMSSCSIPFSAHANGSATVARSLGSSGGSGIRFFVAIGGTPARSAYAPGNGLVPVEQMVLAEVLEPFHAPTALAAREDRAEEDAVALRDTGR